MGADGPDIADGDPTGENLKAVRLHYAAFADGDLDGLIAGLDPNILICVHDEHGKSVGDGIRGRDDARAFFEEIHAEVTHTTVEIEKLRADENKVLAQVSLGGTNRATGVTGAIPAVHLFTLFDGRIREIRTHRPDWHARGAEAD